MVTLSQSKLASRSLELSVDVGWQPLCAHTLRVILVSPTRPPTAKHYRLYRHLFGVIDLRGTDRMEKAQPAGRCISSLARPWVFHYLAPIMGHLCLQRPLRIRLSSARCCPVCRRASSASSAATSMPTPNHYTNSPSESPESAFARQSSADIPLAQRSVTLVNAFNTLTITRLPLDGVLRYRPVSQMG